MSCICCGITPYCNEYVKIYFGCVTKTHHRHRVFVPCHKFWCIIDSDETSYFMQSKNNEEFSFCYFLTDGNSITVFFLTISASSSNLLISKISFEFGNGQQCLVTRKDNQIIVSFLLLRTVWSVMLCNARFRKHNKRAITNK